MTSTLRKWTLPLTIYLVDNASDAPLEKENRTAVWYIRNEKNRGYAGGCNVGIKAAQKDGHSRILLLNSDVEIKQADLNTLVTALINDHDLSLVAPALVEGGKTMVGGRDIGLYLDTRILNKDADHVTPAYLPGTVLLARTSIFDEIGFLDERFFFSGEIADFCARAKGEEVEMVVLDSVRVEHKRPNDSEISTLRLYYNFRNRFLYIMKHHQDKKWHLYLIWIWRISRQAISFLLKGDVSNSRACRLAVWDGVMNNFGNQNRRFGRR